MTRDDLLALTPDALAALANRGLVKRAQKEVAPALEVTADGTVRGRFPDGVTTVLAPGGSLQHAPCSCSATTLCRHVFGVVFAYQAAVAAPASAFEAWSPAEFTDEALVTAFGRRAVAAAERARQRGVVARVRPATPAAPVPAVDLPTCTVRFLVPHALEYAGSDARASALGEVVVLAVWAFRVAGGATAGEVQVELGEKAASYEGFPSLDEAVDTAGEILRNGVVNGGPAYAGRLLQVRNRLAEDRLWWPVAAFDDLREQLAFYDTRHAGYSAVRVAALVAEVQARRRAAAAGAAVTARVLGTEEVGETPLRRVGLVGLGARVTGVGDARAVDLFLADRAAGTVLVLRRQWDDDGSGVPPDVAGKRVAGARVDALATGFVVSENAHRSASRMVRIGTSRVARTTAVPANDPWRDLPDAVVVSDFAAASDWLDRLPLRLVRPRIAAESVRVVRVEDVVEVGYHPGEQRLEATVTDAAGAIALVSADFSAAAPAGLDALAAALRGEHGRPRYVSGSLHRARGRLVVDPLAVAVDGRMVVPDLATSDAPTPLTYATAARVDPLTAALGEALAALAEGAHVGLRHVRDSFRRRVEDAAQGLLRVGLADCARAVGAAATGNPDAWSAAQLRLLAADELR